MLSIECRMFVDSIDAFHRDSGKYSMCLLGSSEIEVGNLLAAFKVSEFVGFSYFCSSYSGKTLLLSSVGTSYQCMGLS